MSILSRTFQVQLDPTVGVIHGLLTIALAFWNLHIVFLLLMIGIAGLVDTFAALYKIRAIARETGDDQYKLRIDVSRSLGKLLLLAVYLLVGVCLDGIVILTGQSFGLESFIGPFQTITPITAVALLVRLKQEWVSVVRNIEDTPNWNNAIWPPLKKALDILKVPGDKDA